jgi:hypothetical protein
MSPADVVVGPPPKADRDHRVGLVLLAVLALAVVSMAVVALVQQFDDRRSLPGPRTPATTTPSYQPAPPIHRLGPAQPQFL